MLRNIKAIPHFLLFKRSLAKPIIEMDLRRWMRECKYAGEIHFSLGVLAWLLELENTNEFRNLFYYRIGRPAGVWDRFLLSLAMILYKPIDTLQILTPSIGPGLLIKHGFGSVIDAVRIGKNCLIFQEVIIGQKDMDQTGKPVIGNSVHIGLGAKILGPITVGDNVDIGANSVVIRDVHPNSVVAGIPARFIKHITNRED
jgi:serine O-acetyltransferase